LLVACFLLGLLEHGGRTFLRKVDKLLPDYTALHLTCLYIFRE
jgi:hypothetical protein